MRKESENRLNKFYNPGSYTAPTEEPELIQQPSSDGDVSGGIFFAQVRARMRKENSGGVFAMLAQISKDVQVSMAEEKKDEEEVQEDYEGAMKQAAEKRAADSQVIVTKEVEKSETVAALQDLKAKKGEKETLLQLAGSKLADLHKFCDFLIETFEQRKQ